MFFVYFIKQKDEVLTVIEKFIKFAENQTNKKMKTPRSDNGREYVHSHVKSTLDQLRIKHATYIHHQPQQNGRSERENRILLDKTKCMVAE